MVLKIAIPIIIQMAITNFVGLLDNIMVGQVGTEQMTGVAVVNQLLFVFNICIFGGVSGAGIFGAQFYGSGNEDGLRYVLRFKMIICVAITLIALALLLLFPDFLIKLFLTDSGEGDVATTLMYGKQYLTVMLWGLAPFSIKEAYASSLKETEETVLPMKAGTIAVAVNLVLNALLIFGLLGFPKLGVVGAALATVISRYIEFAIVIISCHRGKRAFFKGVYKSMYIPKWLIKQIIYKGAPLLLNETMWSAGIVAMNQCYSQRGLGVVAAINITSTIANLFNVVYLSMGSSISVIVGKELGAGRLKEAKSTATKMIAFSVMCCMLTGGLMALCSSGFAGIYKTSDSIKELAVIFICICAVLTPFDALNNAAYFTLRSGGKTFITFLFDSVFLWVISIPVATVLVNFTDWNIIPLYAFCQSLNLIKSVIGVILVKKGIWIQNVVAEKSSTKA
ncbi:MAG: MATE family efflux transporter [Lachnospiraceae bacterium]|nr:MATE family efflux transporter [Lachnospiraceae bacterium]